MSEVTYTLMQLIRCAQYIETKQPRRLASDEGLALAITMWWHDRFQEKNEVAEQELRKWHSEAGVSMKDYLSELFSNRWLLGYP